MSSEWEKQILAYCMRVSRGVVRKGVLKMSVFPDHQAEALGGITAVKLIDLVSYVSRLQNNLKDSIRRRGFVCHLEIGSGVNALMSETGYQLDLLFKDFPVTSHDGYANEIKFCFVYEPQYAPTIIFEDIEVVELNQDTDIILELDDYEVGLEKKIQQKFIQEFDFIDDNDDIKTASNNVSNNTVSGDKKHKKV